MKRLAFTLSLLLCGAGVVRGQDLNRLNPVGEAPLPMERVEPKQEQKPEATPEMHRYMMDLQRYSGPQDLPRQRAQMKAQQRMERMAAMKWYGLSNARPTAIATPFMGSTFAPHWTGNAYNGNWSDRGFYRAFHTAEPPAETLRR